MANRAALRSGGHPLFLVLVTAGRGNVVAHPWLAQEAFLAHAVEQNVDWISHY
jgi:hypothetical protein